MGDDVIVVTRNGRGDVYIATSFAEANHHPLVQYGDVVARGPAELLDLWTVPELVRLGLTLFTEVSPTRAGFERVDMMPGGWDERRSALQPLMGALWGALAAAAQPLPDDPQVTCDLVRRDRQLMEMSMAKAAKNGETTTKAKPEPKPKTHGGFKPEQKITMQKDKDNKPYGGDNNPKRPGSNAAKLFAKYKNGMTVEEFIAAGGTGAALKYDSDHGYIKVA